MSYPRVKRLSEEIKKLTSSIIRNDLKDPRIEPMTSIIEVNVTRDLRYATIYVSVLGNENQKADTIKGLEKASGFIRREIGKKIKARYTPELIFKIDESIERGVYMYDVISKVNEDNSKSSKEEETDE